MKSLCIACFLLVSTFTVHAQSAINTIFKKYAENDKFTAVYISSDMFSLFSNIKVEDQEEQAVLEIIGGLKELHVLTTEEGDGIQLYKEASKKLDLPSYKTLLTVRDKEENVRIYTKLENKVISELLILVGNKDEFVLVSLLGTIDLKKIANLSNVMDIQGLEQLKKIEDVDSAAPTSIH